MRILLATGGSGGHIFPAISVAKRLREQGHQVHLIGVFKDDFQGRIKEMGFDFFEIETHGFSLKNLLNYAVSVVKSTNISLNILREIKPDVVAGFGGYSAVSPLLAAVMRGVPVLIHEQNVVPGKANRALAIFAKRIAVSFERGKKYFSSAKTVLTGCPLNLDGFEKDLGSIYGQWGLEKDRKTILVLGGSQGSHRINDEVLKAVSAWSDQNAIQVVHITGKKDREQIEARYTKLNISHRTFDFLVDMTSAYRIADVVVSRAGATTVSEILFFKLPAVLIPYPYAGGHQSENAKVLAEQGQAKIVEEKELVEEVLSRALQEQLRLAQERIVPENSLNEEAAFRSAQGLAEEILDLKK